MAKKATNKKDTTKSIEQILWDSANELRGNLDAAEYKSVVLGLVFLKYINDCFKTKYDELVAEGEGFEEDPDEYIGDSIFFVPADARWEKIINSALTAEIGVVVDNAMEALERENRQLKGILPKNYARPELDKRRLGNVVDIFENNLHFTGAETATFSAESTNTSSASLPARRARRVANSTLLSVCIRTIVEVIQPYKGRFSTRMRVGRYVRAVIEIHRASSWQYQPNLGLRSGTQLQHRRLAQMNLAIRGIEANFGSSYADSFHDDKHPFLKADFVMANPPFNISKWGGEQLKDDPRWVYGMPPEGNANFAWMQHMLYHLADTGRIGLVLANGSLSSGQGGEGEIRKNIINADR